MSRSAVRFRKAALDRFDIDVELTRDKSLHVIGITGENDSSASRYRCSNNTCINMMSGTEATICQEVAHCSSQTAICVDDFDPGVPFEAGVERGVVPVAAIELGQYSSRNHDVTVSLQCSNDKSVYPRRLGPAGSSREPVHRFRIEYQGSHDRSATAWSISAWSGRPNCASRSAASWASDSRFA